MSKIGKKTISLDGIVDENSVLASKGLQLFTQKSDSDSNQILPTAYALECSTFLSKDTISALEQGVKYATSQIMLKETIGVVSKLFKRKKTRFNLMQ